MLIDRIGDPFKQSSRQPQLEEDVDIARVQKCFALIARQNPEDMEASSRILNALAPSKNMRQIQSAIVTELRSNKGKLKDVEKKIETLVEGIREMDREQSKAEQALIQVVRSEAFLNRVWQILGSTALIGVGLSVCGYEMMRFTAVTSVTAALFAGFWSLSASQSTEIKKRVSTLSTESEGSLRLIEEARAEQGRLNGRLWQILSIVQSAAGNPEEEVAKLHTQWEPMEAPALEEQETPRYPRRQTGLEFYEERPKRDNRDQLEVREAAILREMMKRQMAVQMPGIQEKDSETEEGLDFLFTG